MKLLWIFFFFISYLVSLSADIITPHVFGDNMVLQRESLAPIWGWASPLEDLKLKLDDNNDPIRFKANDSGAWIVKLPTGKAGGPHKIVIEGELSSVTFNNVMFGEVWLCSGQTNMDKPLEYDINGKDAIADAKYPDIRFLQIPLNRSGMPASDFSASWLTCSPEKSTAGSFSAVAYSFGLELHKQLGVPVGLIQATAPGTRSDSWTPLEAFSSNPEFKIIYDRLKKSDSDYKKDVAQHLEQLELWLKYTRKAVNSEFPLTVPPLPPHPLELQNYPSVMFNAMINPLIPYAIKGVIWYQGEANRNNGFKYYDYLKALIDSWRAAWNQGNFPFYFVQIAPFNYGEQPYLLPELWEAQRMVAMTLQNTGMVVINDIANTKEALPKNKLDVGRRLALMALVKTYAKLKKEYSGPLYKSMNVENGKIRISFYHAASGLQTKDKKDPDYFEIAGENRIFTKASVKIDNNTLIVWSDAVPWPAAVRFAWSQDAEPNLMNKDGLPAAPFNTDTKLKQTVPQ